MTDKQIEKAMAVSILEKCGMMVSISDVCRLMNRKNRVKVANMLVGCKEFGENTGKRYYYEEVAEAICRQGGSPNAPQK